MGRLFLHRTTCKKCEKELDGASMVICKKCNLTKTLLWIKNNLEKYQKYQNSYQIKRREISRNYQKDKRATLTGYKTEEYRKYREKYPEKVRAQQILNSAVKRNKIQRSACEVCGENKVHGHHPDYSKPFDVKWLCPIHHKSAHLSINL